MVIKEVVKSAVKEEVKPFITDGAKCLAAGVAYGSAIGLGLEGYKIGKRIVAESAKGLCKAFNNLKKKGKKQPETAVPEQPKTDNPEETTQIQG